MSPLPPVLNLVGIWTTIRLLLLLLLLLLRRRHGARTNVLHAELATSDEMQLGCTDYCFNRAS